MFVCVSRHLYVTNLSTSMESSNLICWALLRASSCLSVCVSKHLYVTNPSISWKSSNLCMLGTPTSREFPNLCMLVTPTSRESPNLCTLAYYQIEIQILFWQIDRISFEGVITLFEQGAVVIVIDTVVGFIQSVPVTTNMRSNPTHGEVYSIQHYVIKFISDLRQVGGLLRVLWFSPPIKLTAMIQLKYC